MISMMLKVISSVSMQYWHAKIWIEQFIGYHDISVHILPVPSKSNKDSSLPLKEVKS